MIFTSYRWCFYTKHLPFCSYMSQFDINAPKGCSESVLSIINTLYVLSQSVQVQGCGVVKSCGGLAGNGRQLPVGKRPGVSPHNPLRSETLSFLHLMTFRVRFIYYTYRLSMYSLAFFILGTKMHVGGSGYMWTLMWTHPKCTTHIVGFDCLGHIQKWSEMHMTIHYMNTNVSPTTIRMHLVSLVCV